jgi:uncharacterized membrane protein
MATTVRGSIWIDRPPTAVLRVLFDQEKMTQWTTDLDSVEIVRGAAGEVGSLARLRYVQGGKSYEMMDELLEYEAGKRIVSCVTGDAIEAEVETILLPADGGTQLNLRWRGTGRPLPLKLMLPFMRGSVARQMQMDLAKLKALVESEERGQGAA